MEFNRRISRQLHEEHAATLALWGGLERAIAIRRDDWPPSTPQMLGMLRSAAAALGGEITRHFEFEERELFPRLAAAGEGDITELLKEEHEVIRACAREFAANLAHDSHDAHGWDRLRVLTLELAERLVAHVQKEEMALLPTLDDLLDDETDIELTSTYVMT
jgi:hemerythrin-like domain-containing protein